jgi:protein SCO1/2
MSTVPSSLTTSRPTRRRLWLLLGGVALLVAAIVGFSLFESRRGDADGPRSTLPIGPASASGQGSTIAPPRTLADFTLTSQTGAPLALHDLRGKAILLFFGYTRCPDVCPTTLGEFKGTKKLLGAAADNVAFVFVSVDPDQDTTEVLARYVGAFDPAFIGLRGDPATLKKIGPDYDLFYRKVPVSGSTTYTVDHTSTAYLIDRQGRLRVIFPYGTPAAALATDVRALLAQP